MRWRPFLRLLAGLALGLTIPVLPAVAAEPPTPAVPGAIAAEASTLPGLSDAERVALRDIPPLRVALVEGQAPLTFVEDGQPAGYLNELLDRVAERLGLALERVRGFSYAESLNALRERNIDLINDYSRHPDFVSYISATDPVLSIPFVAVARHDTAAVGRVADLRGKRVILVDGYIQGKRLRERYPAIDTLEVQDITAAYQALRAGRGDYYLDNAAHAGFHLHNQGRSDLRVAGRFPAAELGVLELRFGVRSDRPRLRSALQKALDALSASDYQALREKWRIRDTMSALGLTPQERAWLAAHPVVQVALDPDWAPVEYRDELGNFQGMSLDYLARLQDLLGIRFEAARDLSWQELVEAVRAKRLDMFASVARTPQREAYLAFTPTYVSMPIHIFAREASGFVGDLKALAGRRVAVVGAYAVHDWLKNEHPDIELTPVPTIEAGLQALADDDVFAFVGNLVTVNYYLGKLRLRGIQVAGETPYANRQAMAVRDDWPLFAGILGKALATFSDDDHKRIIERWMAVRHEYGIDYTLLWQVVVTALLLLAAILYWNRRLAAEIRRRRAAEADLRKHMASAAEIHQQLRDTEYALDRVGIAIHVVAADDGRFLYVNDQAAQMLGYRTEDMLRLGVPDIDPGFPAAQFKQRADAMRNAGAVRFETQHRRRDGSLIPVEATLYYYQPGDGRLPRFIGFVTDISERKRAEAELVQAKEQAESANRAKSLFLANMSHELRTPLNAILGFAQLMQRDPALPEHQRRDLGTINRSGRHLLELINDVLEISRIESGRLTLEPRVFDLWDTLDATQTMMRGRAQKKGLGLALERPADLPRYVQADEHRLRQVLINLLGNALKYTPAGEVTLRVTPGGPDHQVRFEVLDSGPGIEQQERERIFEAFYQTREGSAKGEGTGLGLFISRQYVQLLGGELTVSSEPGRGSCFGFTIPLPPARQAPEPAREPGRVVGLAARQPARRILVVEDDPDSRRLLLRLLERLGLDVREAEDGEQAVALFEQWRPHLIWMDMRMPRLDGYQATRRIKAAAGGHDTVVIALTASAFNEDRQAVLDAGCDEFIRKPVTEEVLYDCMQRWLGLEYRYGDAAPALSAENDREPQITALSEQQRRDLRQAALDLDVERLQQIVLGIAVQDSETAARLEQWVEEYRFEELLQLTDPGD